MDWLKEREDFFPDYTVILQPTAPLRQPFHLKEAIDFLIKSGADSIVSMTEVPGHHNPHWQFILGKENKAKIFAGEKFHKIIKRRQELPKTYTRNGAIYAFRTQLLFGPKPTFYGKDVRAYIMENKYSVNIDSLEDFMVAQMKIKKL